jgi:hypothetical protein
VTPKQIQNLIDSSDGDTELVDGYDELPAEFQEKIDFALKHGHIPDEDWRGVSFPDSHVYRLGKLCPGQNVLTPPRIQRRTAQVRTVSVSPKPRQQKRPRKPPRTTTNPPRAVMNPPRRSPRRSVVISLRLRRKTMTANKRPPPPRRSLADLPRKPLPTMRNLRLPGSADGLPRKTLTMMRLHLPRRPEPREERKLNTKRMTRMTRIAKHPHPRRPGARRLQRKRRNMTMILMTAIEPKKTWRLPNQSAAERRQLPLTARLKRPRRGMFWARRLTTITDPDRTKKKAAADTE